MNQILFNFELMQIMTITGISFGVGIGIYARTLRAKLKKHEAKAKVDP